INLCTQRRCNYFQENVYVGGLSRVANWHLLLLVGRAYRCSAINWTYPEWHQAGMIRSFLNLANKSRNEPSVGWYSWKPAKRLLVMSVTTSISRPRSISVCQADWSLLRSAPARPYFPAIFRQIGPISATCGASRVAWPG